MLVLFHNFVLGFLSYNNLYSDLYFREWNFRRLSGYELAGNETFLRHERSGDWGS